MNAPNRPNVVLILTDQQQAGMMGCAGHPRLRTPAMDRLATEGCRFTHAFCPTPQCSPTRASLLTGLYPHRAGVPSNVHDSTFGPPQLSTDLPSMGVLLQAAGYQTAYFGKWHLGADDDPTSNPLAYGFGHFVPSRLGTERETEDDLADEAAAYIAGYDGQQPLLLVASFHDPHGVYQLNNVTQPLDVEGVALPASFGDDLSTKPKAQRIFRDQDQPRVLSHDAETARRYLAWYAYMTERADGYLDRMLTALDAHPALAGNTIVLFASDHGDLGFAHGIPFKGPCMYDELVRVPLLMRGPGLPAGRVVDELVTLTDLLPTICALTGVAPPAELQSESLTPLLRDMQIETPWRDAVIGQYHGKQRWAIPIRMIRTKQHKFTRYRTGERELYDLDADPHEMVNLAGNEQVAEIEAELACRLQGWMDEHGDAFDEQIVTDRQGVVP